MSHVSRVLTRLVLTVLLAVLGAGISFGQPGEDSTEPAAPSEPSSTNLLDQTPATQPATTKGKGKGKGAVEVPVVIPPPIPADSLLLGPHLQTGEVRQGGGWTLDSSFNQQDQSLEFNATLTIESPGLWYWLPQTKGVYLVLMAERLFDGDGVYCYGPSGRGTTLLTPTGLPAVGSLADNPTDAFGGIVRHPGNRLILVTPDQLTRSDDKQTVTAHYSHKMDVGGEFPAGWYRFIAQIGVQLSPTEFTTLQGNNPAEVILNSTNDSVARFPLTAVKTAAEPTIPLALFTDVHPGGGALPTQMAGKIGIIGRQGFNESTILPPLGPDGVQQQYRLDPAIPFLLDATDPARTFPLALDTTSGTGRLSMSLTTPDEAVFNFGEARITGLDNGVMATDRSSNLFSFSRFGLHTLTVSGFVNDTAGQRYHLGGDYPIWVAMPLDLRVATLPGTPGIEKESFSLAARTYPPVPAKIVFTQLLAVHGSDKIRRRMFDCWADEYGEFVPELKPNKKQWWSDQMLFFENDGEYRLSANASYDAPDGTLYMGEWASANVVLPPLDETEDDDESLGLLPAFGGLGARGVATIDEGVDFPFEAGELLVVAPGTHAFDPHLYGRGEAGLVERRLLPASALVDLTNGERGFLPGSGTPQGYPAAGYPEARDRSGRLYAWAVGPGLPTRALIRDGASDLSDLNAGPSLTWPDTGLWTLFGGVSIWDTSIQGSAQGAYTGGLAVSGSTSHFQVLDPSSGTLSLPGTTLPELHQFAVGPGTLLKQFATFTPQCYVFPPAEGQLETTLRRPDGSEVYLPCVIDARGLAVSRTSYSTCEIPGVYTVTPKASIAERVFGTDSYQIYVYKKDSD
ncbi:MAG: hypothetical protein ABI743_10680, partial [bacterium]